MSRNRNLVLFLWRDKEEGLFVCWSNVIQARVSGLMSCSGLPREQSFFTKYMKQETRLTLFMTFYGRHSLSLSLFPVIWQQILLCIHYNWFIWSRIQRDVFVSMLLSHLFLWRLWQEEETRINRGNDTKRKRERESKRVREKTGHQETEKRVKRVQNDSGGQDADIRVTVTDKEVNDDVHEGTRERNKLQTIYFCVSCRRNKWEDTSKDTAWLTLCR